MNRIVEKKWPVISMVLLIFVTLVMGWFAGRLIPGTPRPPQNDTASYHYAGNAPVKIPALETVDVKQGEALRLEEITQGDRYTINPSDSSNPEEFERFLKQLDSYHVEYDTFVLSIDETKIISGEALKEWYPSFSLPDSSTLSPYWGSHLPGKAFLVSIHVQNPSEDQALILPKMTLQSPQLNQLDNTIGSGASPLLNEAQSLNPSVSFSFAKDSSTSPAPSGNNGLLTLAPGESKEIILPYYIYKNSFISEEAYSTVDLSQFFIEVDDYDPGVCYRFFLA